MKKTSNDSPNDRIDFFLDITPDTCPITFVKTKLLIERMAPGQVAEIRLEGAEPLDNVPRSVREFGHTVLSLEPEDPAGGPASVHRMVVRKEKVVPIRA